jgi:hypothetical protein
LAAVPDEEPDSAAMRERFAATLSRHKNRSVPTWSGWRLACEAAAVLVALAGGVVIGRQAPTSTEVDAGTLRAMRQELRDVREMLTLSLMQQNVASERIKGVATAARMEDPPSDVVTALLETLMHDPSVNVRLACVRALERFIDHSEVRAGVAQAVSRETSPLVSMALIDFIVEAGDRMAIDALRELSEDAERDRAVRDSVAEAVNRLLSVGRV